ncbi:spore germination protein [Bacillus sp. Marseille-P3661]|uniref:spore germination protein n=1 Tax=Bacillus sp. Marseille-P3661 TaxID=1936234 RepID=UPI000C8525E4|nr:spore germination protein [Bacillus sp. Marseille-P3661]
MAGAFFFNTQGVKINNISGNASINSGEANLSGNGIDQKNIGIAFSIGDFSPVFNQQINRYVDPDFSDFNEGASPSNAQQI